MVKMMTAYTEEVDEVEDGVAELLGQIDLGALKKNSVGIVTCHFDFIHPGFIAEMHKRLPFDFIGMTTMASTNPQGQGMYSLAMTVLTSDELIFETVISESLAADENRKEIEAAYSEAAQKLPGDPSLIITLFPNLKHLSGAGLHKTLDEICGGIPIWGGAATHTYTSDDRCSTFRNCDLQKDCMAMLLVHGPIDPEFIVVSLPLKNIHRNQGKVTSSDGCVIKEINGIPATKYLDKNLGVTLLHNAPLITPLIVYYEDTPEPVALAIYADKDDGSISCGGEVPEGSSVAIGEISSDSIMASAKEALDRALSCEQRNGLLVLPCVSRYVMLQNREDELNLIAGKMKSDKTMPYMVGYAGGEICPVRDRNGVLRNRFHNFTFSACVF